MSPNNQYRLTVIDHDEGAFGGATSVDLQHDHFGILRKTIRQVYIGEWAEKPNTQWIDNETALIDGKRVSVFSEQISDTR